ncbi:MULTISPECIES: substrate-binding domain-containing protein [Chryseobacterium]|uniref:hybrid sensor histidine kinase/response regulator transcription factor n=1 Tax=Chryseobacterium TaxID=59732 RepID=UPI00195D9754|nr:MULTISPECIES: substrate-binding domain-containing protein [Chryseobacterium]MBM7420249.1 signal transduction histidine kinase/AraC-like DNA-binding protein/cellobiose-specific phosphotransferase system component IIB [Chryseobacterium sp. JUb44]MDH6210193.1 signal transduction histidine kinase/AraC-like DNA-binding protein/ABC-type xylose transport system substrate-binding protein [Chryseobacterium sp. BIGb0186]WSO08911.1 substrate-binding domain-containing protein [Chryseobacterium scophthalm
MKLKSTYFCLFLIFFLNIFLGCSNDKDSDKLKIGFSQGLGNHPWRDAMNHSMKIQASLHSDLDLHIMKAEKSVQKQISDIQKMIEAKTDIIIISPIDSYSLVSIIEKAYNKGIPVILLDRKIDSEKYTTYIGADNIEIGREAAKYIISDSKSEKKILEIRGDDNSSPSLERSLGFQEIIKKQTDAHLVESFKGFPAEKFKNTLQSLDHQNLYVFAFNDELASQAWQLARHMGFENNIKFIGVDGLNNKDGGIQMVMDGKLNATLLYPSGGAEAIETAIKIHKGNTVPKRIKLGTTIIDQFNAEIMKNQFDRILDQQGTIEHQVEAIEKTTNLYSSQSILLQWSIVLLTTMLCSVAYCIYLIYAVKYKNKQLTLTNEKITIQRNQIENIANELKESNEVRANFFTGISHEFKTPITLILSSVDSLKDKDKSSGKKSYYELELINKNSNRLLRLIDNLLDFRKTESKTFNLRVSKTNIYDFSYSVYRDFENEAKKRNIKFDLLSHNKTPDLYMDRNLMDKVYFNLLSNAFKFTPDNGKIEISIYEKGNEVSIHFKDNGIGIPNDELHNVFQPFFKGSNNRKNSSGIGLHLSKEFVKLHLGKIEVNSFQGTEFIITLYKGNKHFNEDQIIREPDLIEASFLEEEPDYINIESEYDENIKSAELRYTLLLIEDNRDLSHFLQNKLQNEFDVLLSDGTDAIEKALQSVPDIIICDVNLPDKNGFEICEILKNDLRTSHIPNIILTALDNKESYIKGLKSGVDLYLTKPFNYPILRQSLRSLLFNREKLRYYYTNNINRVSAAKPFDNIEQQFVSNLNKNINKNLDNPEFSVENLAEALHVSRVQLYRKVKAIFNENVSDYINNIRLEQSKIMLQDSKLTISEIAYKNGFSSPNYFSTVFKSKYGVSPNAFRKSLTDT